MGGREEESKEEGRAEGRKRGGEEGGHWKSYNSEIQNNHSKLEKLLSLYYKEVVLVLL